MRKRARWTMGMAMAGATALSGLLASHAKGQTVFSSDDTFLAVDETAFETQEGLSLSLVEATKYEGNPVLKRREEGAPDSGRLSFPWVLQEDGRFRMWYVAYDGERFLTCYAESEDGYTWTRPDLGVVNYRGTKANNVIDSESFATSPSVYYDAQETDPAKRYKTTIYGTITEAHMDTEAQRKKYPGAHPSLRCIAYSPDGIHWTRDTRNPFPIKAKLECPVLYRMNDKWVVAHQMNSADYPQVNRWSRFLGVSTSDDLVNWELSDKPAFYFDPKYNGIIQTHVSPGFQDYGNVMVAAEGLFLNQHELLDQEADIMLLVTNDGRQWRQPKSSQPLTYLLRRGGRGSWDESFLVQGNLLNTGDTTRLYYCGGHYGNAGFIGIQIGAAELRLDGFGYLAPEIGWSYSKPEYQGRLQSRPIRIEEAGLGLYLNYWSLGRAGDRVTAELQNEQGQPLAGFTHAECDPLPADSVGAGVTWQGNSDLSAFEGETVRVELRVTGANPKRWPMARAEVPRVFAFYLDRPVLWHGEATDIEPGHGQVRLDFRDPLRGRLHGLRVDADAPRRVTLTDLTDDSATLTFTGEGKVRLHHPGLTRVTVQGQDVPVAEHTAEFEVAAGQPVAIQFDSAA